MQRRDHAPGRIVEQDGADSACAANSKALVAEKNGSYCRTGLPLLLKIVQPEPTQRGETTGRHVSGPAAACALLLDLAAETSE